MSGISNRLRSGRYSEAWTPHAEPAVLRWLRFNQTTSTYDAVPDQRGGADAVQGTSARRPAGATLNSQPGATFDGTDDFLTEPIAAANNGALTRGMMFWFRPA